MEREKERETERGREGERDCAESLNFNKLAYIKIGDFDLFISLSPFFKLVPTFDALRYPAVHFCRQSYGNNEGASARAL